MSVLRLQVTRRCQLRCGYCRPELALGSGERDMAPAFAARLAGVLAKAGVRRVRLTGGEPLLHAGILSIVRRLSRLDGLEEVALTTNGQDLERLAPSLRRAGLRRVNVHIDTLRADRYRAVAGGCVERAVAGLRAAVRARLAPKLNVVVQRGVNDDEIPELCALGAETGACVRFIELMETGVAPALVAERFVSAREIRSKLELLGARCVGSRGAAPAVEYRLRDGTLVGLISSETEPFCGACDRLRVDAGGLLRTCLYEAGGLDLGGMAARGAGDGELLSAVREVLSRKRSLHPATRDSGAPRVRFSMALVGG